jgi:hypothetical protein
MADKPRDKFEQYFAEKLWEMIPSIYRHEDGIAENPGVLRALVEVLAEQAAILRRSHDRLWDDQFIELCDDWAVPYLADLVGTRLVSALNQRGRRVDVAKTIYYRRRKGTLHRLDPHPGLQAGRLSGTLPGGWADLRRPQAAELTGGPFDEFYRTPDMRQHRGVDGRYGIPKLAFHLYRLRAFRVEGVTPRVCSGALFGSGGVDETASTVDEESSDEAVFGEGDTDPFSSTILPTAVQAGSQPLKGRQAVRIHGNIIEQPVGQALVVQGLGPISVMQNQLHTDYAFAEMVAGAVLVNNIGRALGVGSSKNVFAQIGAGLLNGDTLFKDNRTCLSFGDSDQTGCGQCRDI